MCNFFFAWTCVEFFLIDLYFLTQTDENSVSFIRAAFIWASTARMPFLQPGCTKFFLHQVHASVSARWRRSPYLLLSAALNGQLGGRTCMVERNSLSTLEDSSPRRHGLTNLDFFPVPSYTSPLAGPPPCVPSPIQPISSAAEWIPRRWRISSSRARRSSHRTRCLASASPTGEPRAPPCVLPAGL